MRHTCCTISGTLWFITTFLWPLVLLVMITLYSLTKVSAGTWEYCSVPKQKFNKKWNRAVRGSDRLYTNLQVSQTYLEEWRTVLTGAVSTHSFPLQWGIIHALLYQVFWPKLFVCLIIWLLVFVAPLDQLLASSPHSKMSAITVFILNDKTAVFIIPKGVNYAQGHIIFKLLRLFFVQWRTESTVTLQSSGTCSSGKQILSCSVHQCMSPWYLYYFPIESNKV